MSTDLAAALERIAQEVHDSGALATWTALDVEMLLRSHAEEARAAEAETLRDADQQVDLADLTAADTDMVWLLNEVTRLHVHSDALSTLLRGMARRASELRRAVVLRKGLLADWEAYGQRVKADRAKFAGLLTDALGLRNERLGNWFEQLVPRACAEIADLRADVERLRGELAGMSDVAASMRDFNEQQFSTLHTMICTAAGLDPTEPWPGNAAAADALDRLRTERDEARTLLRGMARKLVAHRHATTATIADYIREGYDLHRAEIGELRTEIERLAARKWTLADLPDDAARIRTHLAAHGLDTPHGQVLCVVEEAGELAAAYRRWAGLARRAGPWSDVVAELADVVLSAVVLAARLDIDITQAVADKIGVVHTRGWREVSCDDTGPDEGTCPECRCARPFHKTWCTDPDALPGEGGER